MATRQRAWIPRGMTFAEWFARQIARESSNAPDTCWEWTGKLDPHGYGFCDIVHGGYRGRPVASRLAWILAFGPIPPGRWVLHTCDNRKCCRPSHLKLGTRRTNMADMVRKGRQAHGERLALARYGKVVLTDAQVRAIRTAYDGRHGAAARLAKQYGVSTTEIYGILTGKWRRSAGGPRPVPLYQLTPEMVTDIRAEWQPGKIKPLARKYHVVASTIRAVIDGTGRYSDLPALRTVRRSKPRKRR